MKKSFLQTSILAIAILSSATANSFAQSHPQEKQKSGSSKQVATNAQLGRDFVETAMNAKSADQLVTTIQRIYSTDFTNHNPMVAPGRDGVISFVGTIGESFPGSKATINNIIADKDKVMVAWTFEGSLSGKAFLGVPAQNQKVKIDVVDYWKVRNGQFVEHWDLIDWVSLLAQLGVKEIPEPFKNIAAQKLNN